MKQMRFLPVLLILLIMSVGVGCIRDDITMSSDARLEFSTDTLSFDTIFTNLGSATARLVVFNPQKKGINISEIKFANPDTRFKMNVDGMSGDVFHDIEIRGGDSIFLFVECFLPEEQGDLPVLTTDDIEFLLNGNRQTVRVEAWGQNVERLRNLKVDADMTLTADKPYVVFDSITISEGAKLTLQPGCRLLFHDKARMVVEGTLEAVGTPEKPIHMRGDRTGNILTDVSYDLMAGQWEGIRIAAGSFGNRMEYVDMRSTVSGLKIDSCGDLSRQKILLRNSWLHNSQSHVLQAKHANIEAVGMCFSESPGAVVELTGGVARFTQTTISNYYLFSAVTEPLLCLYHCLPQHQEEDSAPLMSATFDNCIIYGLGSDINEGDLTGSDVFLRYVLLKSEGTDDANFQNCIWGADPLFYTDREKYYFNYRLRPESPAIGAGDPVYAEGLALTDFFGLNRLADGLPALGAYVYQPTEDPGATLP